MKRVLWLLLFFGALHAAAADHLGVYQHGVVVRMRMSECIAVPHGFMVTMGGPPVQLGAESCPEYTLVSDTVVYIIVGSSSNAFIPLADVIDFRSHKGEVAVRINDARKETKFGIKEMILRSEWDRMQQHIDDQMKAAELREARR